MSQVNGGGGSGGAGVTSVTGTTNQVTATPTTGAVIVSTPSTFVAPGSIASTTANSAGTQFLAADGTQLLPSYSFTSTPTAGFFLSNSNEIDLTWAAGLQTVRFLSSQTIFNNNLAIQGTARIVIQDGTLANPSFTFGSNTSIGLMLSGTNLVFTNSGTGVVGISASDFICNIKATFAAEVFIGGGMCASVTTPGAYPYTTVFADYCVLVDTSSARTINLFATPVQGEILFIKDNTGTAGANNITIQGNGKNIDGAASKVINSNFGSLQFIYNGTQWNLI